LIAYFTVWQRAYFMQAANDKADRTHQLDKISSVLIF
jgi:hypothetical protein